MDVLSVPAPGALSPLDPSCSCAGPQTLPTHVLFQSQGAAPQYRAPKDWGCWCPQREPPASREQVSGISVQPPAMEGSSEMHSICFLSSVGGTEPVPHSDASSVTHLHRPSPSFSPAAPSLLPPESTPVNHLHPSSFLWLGSGGSPS